MSDGPPIPEVTLEEFFTPLKVGSTGRAPRFNEEYETTLRRILADQTRQFNALVLLRCDDMSSSWLGAQEVLLIGPLCTYKSADELRGKWINGRGPDNQRHDLASNRLYPICWTRRPEIERAT